jgi:hypothetical protein
VRETARHNQGMYLQPAFLICTAVLLLAGAGMSVVTNALGVYLTKVPLPLKKPLDALAGEKLAPYKVVMKFPIDNPEILKSLGTRDYIQWVLEDPDQPAASATRKVLLFITYYELPDRVPHVPEECYTGSGYQRLRSEAVTFHTRGAGGQGDVPGRLLVFQAPAQELWQGVAQFPVLYLFRVNGEYAGNRDEARMALNKNIFSRYSYFSKIELAFNQANVTATKEDAVAAGERLLAVLLPLLEQNHWPEQR